MTIAWRELQKPDNICKMYEGAVKKEPQNEEFLSHLFMSYVRLGGHKKQQLVAMNLYKAAHKNPYYFWSVMSVVLQAMDDERLGRAVQLPLALKMLQKMESEGKVEQEQEVLLFCLVLEMQEDWQAAVAFLKGPLGQRLGDNIGTLEQSSPHRIGNGVCCFSEIRKLSNVLPMQEHRVAETVRGVGGGGLLVN